MEISFLKLFWAFISNYESPKLPEDKRSANTINAYKNKCSLVFEFLEENSLHKIKATEFSKKTARLYFEWLISKDYSNNYAVRCVEICSQVLAFGASKDLITHNPLDYLTFKKDRPKKPPYLTPEQITAFETYKSDDIGKQRAAHMAIVSINTGFDYGDFEQISRSHIKVFRNRKWIIKGRHKNGNEAFIPLAPIVEYIFEMYDYNMRLLSNFHYNKNVRKVAEDLGIPIYLTTKGLRKIFIMNQLNNKLMPVAAVSKMAGHKKIATTEEFYAEVRLELIENELSKLGL